MATAGGGSAGKLLAKGVKALKQAGAAAGMVTGLAEEAAKHGDDITTTAQSAREIAEQAAKQADEAAPATKKATHKNSLDYDGDTHVYAVRNPDGTVNKIGESAQGTRLSDGAS